MDFKLWKFHGGLKLQGHKKLSMHEPIVKAAIPSILVHPLQQHIGEPAQPVVKVGEHVLKGQLIADFKDHIGSPVHASTSGTVIAIEEHAIPHASGLNAPCIVIEADGKDTPFEYPVYDYTSLEAEQLRKGSQAFPGILGQGRRRSASPGRGGDPRGDRFERRDERAVQRGLRFHPPGERTRGGEPYQGVPKGQPRCVECVVPARLGLSPAGTLHGRQRSLHESAGSRPEPAGYAERARYLSHGAE